MIFRSTAIEILDFYTVVHESDINLQAHPKMHL